MKNRSNDYTDNVTRIWMYLLIYTLQLTKTYKTNTNEKLLIQFDIQIYRYIRYNKRNTICRKCQCQYPVTRIESIIRIIIMVNKIKEKIWVSIIVANVCKMIRITKLQKSCHNERELETKTLQLQVTSYNFIIIERLVSLQIFFIPKDTICAFVNCHCCFVRMKFSFHFLSSWIWC